MKVDSSEAVYAGMMDAGIDFTVSVPCVNLRAVLEMVDADPGIMHVPVTREEEASVSQPGPTWLEGQPPY